MSYEIIVRFPDKETADEFCGQMSDGFGENLCDFRHHQQIPGTNGMKPEHFERVEVDGRQVYFVNGLNLNTEEG